MEYIIAFKSTNIAIKAEQALLEQNIGVSVLPLPPQIRTGCGICLRVSPDAIKAALKVLDEGGIDEAGLFMRKACENLFIYSEISDGDRYKIQNR